MVSRPGRDWKRIHGETRGARSKERKRGATDKSILRSSAPALDPNSTSIVPLMNPFTFIKCLILVNDGSNLPSYKGAIRCSGFHS